MPPARTQLAAQAEAFATDPGLFSRVGSGAIWVCDYVSLTFGTDLAGVEQEARSDCVTCWSDEQVGK